MFQNTEIDRVEWSNSEGCNWVWNGVASSLYLSRRWLLDLKHGSYAYSTMFVYSSTDTLFSEVAQIRKLLQDY